MESPSPVQPGDELAGKYRIEQVLARGGMGVVVSAHHLRLDERVAIKFLLPESLANPEAVARFEREARAAARIRSEHSVRVRDVGTLEWGAPYMVMEYLEGRDLFVELSQRRSLPVEEALDYLLQACEAVAEAHSLGVVHRDLKPANLFLSTRPDGSVCVKVLDFGISKLSKNPSAQTSPDYGMTQAATLLGSPYYMAPEQVTSAREVDHRADIWALGVILYEMLSGHRPFEADTLQSLAVAVVTQPPPALSSDAVSIPPALVDVVMSCLEKDRERRIGTVAELASRLAAFAPQSARLSIDRIVRLIEGTRVQSYPPTVDGNQTVAVATAPPQRTHWGFSMTGNWTASRARRFALASGVLGACLIVGAVWWTRARDATDARREPGRPETTVTYVRAASQPESSTALVATPLSSQPQATTLAASSRPEATPLTSLPRVEVTPEAVPVVSPSVGGASNPPSASSAASAAAAKGHPAAPAGRATNPSRTTQSKPKAAESPKSSTSIPSAVPAKSREQSGTLGGRL